jgi:predicted nicotinamide N-methyase
VSYVRHRFELGDGAVAVLQPADAAELPDDGPIEWAPLVPYWSVLWRSGVALARVVTEGELAGLRVVELGCGLGVPSLAAARAGAHVLATDAEPEALELLERNARANGVEVATAHVDWRAAGGLVERGPFDLVLAADVLYERAAAGELLALLPRLAREVWLADPGRPAAAAFVAAARERWSVATAVRDGIAVHRLAREPHPRRADRAVQGRGGSGPTSASLAARGSRLIRASSRSAAERSATGITAASSTGSRLRV